MSIKNKNIFEEIISLRLQMKRHGCKDEEISKVCYQITHCNSYEEALDEIKKNKIKYGKFV